MSGARRAVPPHEANLTQGHGTPCPYQLNVRGEPKALRGRMLRNLFLTPGGELEAPPPCFTPAAARAWQALGAATDWRWLRAEIGVYALCVRNEGIENFLVAGVTALPRVWTVRLEDFAEHGTCYRLTIWRDALKVDEAEGEVEEIFDGVRGTDKIGVEMVHGGGFVLRLEATEERPFRMVKGLRE